MRWGGGEGLKDWSSRGAGLSDDPRGGGCPEDSDRGCSEHDGRDIGGIEWAGCEI